MTHERNDSARPLDARVWQRMLSGRRLDLLAPSAADIEVEDIAHGLARVARWNGQTSGSHIFSVAQHSLLVEAIAAALEPGLATGDRLAVLLHDAPEYVIGDLISPFKTVVGDAYKSVEQRILEAVYQRFDLPAPAPWLSRLMKRADRAAAFTEAIRLAGFEHGEAVRLFGPVEIQATAFDHCTASLSSNEAERLFLDRFRTLQDAAPASGAGEAP